GRGGGGRGGGGGGRGGGGGGRGGGGGAGGDMQEKPGSTRILTILPEGTPVRAGEVVCTLDAAAFRDEAMAQRIREAQARAWVEQARALYEVNQIALREYRDGIAPQDADLLRQHVTTCQIDEGRGRRNLEWSRGALAKRV